MAPRVSNKLALVLAWDEQRLALAKLRPSEMEKRLEVVDACFDADLQTGTTRVDLGQGFGLKAVVDPKAAITHSALQAAFDALCDAEGHDVAKLLYDRLIKHTPEVRVSEWKKLTDAQREIFKDAIAIGRSTPSLELIRP